LFNQPPEIANWLALLDWKNKIISSAMRILLAEDEAKVAQHLAKGLAAEGYAVDVARDGNEALWLAKNHPYDVMALDVMMPGKDGFAVVRQLRREQIFTPVIFLTARGEVEDRVHGLDAGGDDYLTKPFSLAELLARLRALLRRQRPQSFNLLRVADLELDLVSHTARRAGKEIELTKREFALLEFLMISTPKPVSKTAIIEHVWDQHFDSETNVVNVYINHLRRKIDRLGLVPLLHTMRGRGFAVREEES
jgi:two-component system copper resistance phosphate regulon response regulator CusR